MNEINGVFDSGGQEGIPLFVQDQHVRPKSWKFTHPIESKAYRTWFQHFAGVNSAPDPLIRSQANACEKPKHFSRIATACLHGVLSKSAKFALRFRACANPKPACEE